MQTGDLFLDVATGDAAVVVDVCVNDDFNAIDYSYFKGAEIIEQLEGSYADRNAEIKYTTVTWTHSLSEVINSLIQAGVYITRFEEYDYSPYNCFKHTIQIDKDKYRIKHLSDKLPMIYAITGVSKKIVEEDKNGKL